VEGSEVNKPLTTKQDAFCQEYLKDLNGTRAAIRAGYSKKGAHVQAAQLLSNPNVSTRLQELKAQRSQRTQIDADWVLRRLEQDSAADIADLYDEEGKLKAVKDWPKAFRTGLVAGVETAQIGEGGVITVKKVKLADRARYLEMIGRHIDVGAFKDKLEVDVVDSLAARLERVRAKRAQR
jgi:phage terminase small subunit